MDTSMILMKKKLKSWGTVNLVIDAEPRGVGSLSKPGVPVRESTDAVGSWMSSHSGEYLDC